MTPTRRHAAFLTAVLLTALLPSPALAAEPVAVDDPSVDCGNSGFGGAFPIPEDFSGGSPEEFERWFVFIGACNPLANDTDADGDPLTMELVGQPPHGEALVTDVTWLTYRADPDYSTIAGDEPGGDWFSDVITYRALDGGSPSNEAAMRLWIAPINDPPTFTPGPGTVEATEDSGEYSAAWATDVAAGPGNESGQTVSFEVTDLDVTGVPDLFAVPPAIASDGTLTFTPGPDQFGLASVTVRATDDGGLEDYGMPSGWMDPADDTSDETTFEIVVWPENSPPVADDEVLTVAEDAPATAVPVLTGDVDSDGDPLEIVGTTSSSKGTVVVTGGGTGLTYQPNANANGSDAFFYSIEDGRGGTDTATVNVTITAANDAPVAMDDAASVPNGPASAIPVRVNDTDVDGDTLTIASKTNGAKGTVAITGGGTGLTYDPAALAIGTDTFTYTVDDGHGGTDTATVTVTIAPDSTGPSITAVSESLPGQTIGTSTIRARLTWTGTDAGSGINNYHVQVSVDGGAWSTLPLASPTATSLDRILTIGTSYRFRVRAKDLSGNVGAFREWAAMVPARYQETSSVASYTGAWSTVVNPLASGGATRAATANDRKVTVTFIGYDVGWVATRRTSSGAAQVRIDGVLIATVDLDTTADAYRQLVFARHFTSLAKHTLEIRPVGDGRVDLDAIVVLR